MSAGAELQTLLKKHPLSAVAIAISVACGVLLYIRSSTVAERADESTRLADEATKMQSNITASSGLEEQTERVREATKEVDSRLVRVSQLATNLQYFYRMEADSGVKILDVRQHAIPPVRAGAPKTIYNGVPYNVSVQGTFAQTLSFMKRIESGRHFVRFTNVTYTKAGGTDPAAGDVMNLTINLELLGQP